MTFAEFLVASLSAEEILTPARLNTAFKTLDKDRSGTLDIDELKEALSKYAVIADEIWV